MKMFHGKSNRFSPSGSTLFTSRSEAKYPTKQFRAGVHHERLCNSETIACGGCSGERPLGKIAFIANKRKALLGYYLRVSEKGCTAKLLQSYCKPNSETIAYSCFTGVSYCISTVKSLHRGRQKRANSNTVACSGLRENYVKNYTEKNSDCNRNLKTHGRITYSAFVYCNRYRLYRKTLYFSYCNLNSEMICCDSFSDLSYCKSGFSSVFRKSLQLSASGDAHPSEVFRFRVIIDIPIRENRF